MRRSHSIETWLLCFSVLVKAALDGCASSARAGPIHVRRECLYIRSESLKELHRTCRLRPSRYSHVGVLLDKNMAHVTQQHPCGRWKNYCSSLLLVLSFMACVTLAAPSPVAKTSDAHLLDISRNFNEEVGQLTNETSDVVFRQLNNHPGKCLMCGEQSNLNPTIIGVRNGIHVCIRLPWPDTRPPRATGRSTSRPGHPLSKVLPRSAKLQTPVGVFKSLVTCAMEFGDCSRGNATACDTCKDTCYNDGLTSMADAAISAAFLARLGFLGVLQEIPEFEATCAITMVSASLYCGSR